MKINQFIEQDFIDELDRSNLNRRLIQYSLFIKDSLSLNISDRINELLKSVYNKSKELPSGALLAAFSDPSFGYWLYISKNILNRLKNGEQIPKSDVPHLNVKDQTKIFESHINDLNRWLLVASVLSRNTFEGQIPSINGSIYIPFWGLVIENCEDIEITSYRYYNSRHELSIQGTKLKKATEALNKTIVSSSAPPKISNIHGTILIDICDPYIVGGWSGSYKDPSGKKYILIKDINETDIFKNINAALGLIENLWPELHANIFTLIKTIHFIESPYDDRHVSCTNNYFSGALLMSNGDEYLLAEATIHEYYHNVLDLMIANGDIFEGAPPKEEIYYSPWRPDARHIAGVLHAVFVFTNVAIFLDKAIKVKTSNEELEYRLKTILVKLKLGVEVLRKFHFTKPIAISLIFTLNSEIKTLFEKHQNTDFSKHNEIQMEHINGWELKHPELIDGKKNIKEFLICK